jgi:hypothetical protein
LLQSGYYSWKDQEISTLRVRGTGKEVRTPADRKEGDVIGWRRGPHVQVQGADDAVHQGLGVLPAF